MKRLLLLGLATIAAPAGAQTFAAAPMPDPELARERGGFSLPGGITVTLGVTTDTRVDGQEVLRTVLSLADGGPKLAVLGATGGAAMLGEVELTANGAGVATRDGVVRLRQSGDNTRVDLAGNGVDISHLVGRGALGSIVANATDNRVIQVETSVDIGLAGVRPDQLGGAMAQAGNLALDATTQLVR